MQTVEYADRPSGASRPQSRLPACQSNHQTSAYSWQTVLLLRGCWTSGWKLLSLGTCCTPLFDPVKSVLPDCRTIISIWRINVQGWIRITSESWTLYMSTIWYIYLAGFNLLISVYYSSIISEINLDLTFVLLCLIQVYYYCFPSKNYYNNISRICTIYFIKCVPISPRLD